MGAITPCSIGRRLYSAFRSRPISKSIASERFPQCNNARLGQELPATLVASSSSCAFANRLRPLPRTGQPVQVRGHAARPARADDLRLQIPARIRQPTIAKTTPFPRSRYRPTLQTPPAAFCRAKFPAPRHHSSVGPISSHSVNSCPYTSCNRCRTASRSFSTAAFRTTTHMLSARGGDQQGQYQWPHAVRVLRKWIAKRNHRSLLPFQRVAQEPRTPASNKKQLSIRHRRSRATRLFRCNSVCSRIGSQTEEQHSVPAERVDRQVLRLAHLSQPLFVNLVMLFEENN